MASERTGGGPAAGWVTASRRGLPERSRVAARMHRRASCPHAHGRAPTSRARPTTATTSCAWRARTSPPPWRVRRSSTELRRRAASGAGRNPRVCPPPLRRRGRRSKRPFSSCILLCAGRTLKRSLRARVVAVTEQVRWPGRSSPAQRKHEGRCLPRHRRGGSNASAARSSLRPGTEAPAPVDAGLRAGPLPGRSVEGGGLHTRCILTQRWI